MTRRGFISLLLLLFVPATAAPREPVRTTLRWTTRDGHEHAKVFVG